MKNVIQLVNRLLGRWGWNLEPSRPEPPYHLAAHPEAGVGDGCQIVSFRWATMNGLFELKRRNLYSEWSRDAANYGVDVDLMALHQWSIKGHGYSSVVDFVGRRWDKNRDRLTILDVGAGGSALASVLSERFGHECWVVDDFGQETNDKDTAQWYPPHLRDELVANYPYVHYVFSRLGSPCPELRPGYFDVVYSISTLEHIPIEVMGSIFDHMMSLLSENSGVMLHAIDITVDQFLVWREFLSSYFDRFGVDRHVFDIPNLNDLPTYDPPLSESAEAIFRHWGNVPRYLPLLGSLCLEVRKLPKQLHHE